MTEPVSTTIGGFAAWKAFGMTIVVAICVMAVAAVVLMM
ncbi:putative membrane protein, partial [Acinetobacter baumannii 426863]